MSQCESTYILDTGSGEKLRCEHRGTKHPINLVTGDPRHYGEYGGIIWYWNDGVGE